MTSVKFLAGAVAGAAGMYFADPVNGRGRRRRTSAKLQAARRRRQRNAERQASLAAGRAVGEQARARGAGQFHPTDDRSVELHLHDLLAGLDTDTKDVNVEVVEGLARVRGQVTSGDDMQRVVDLVHGCPGVRSVESFLHLPDEPAPNKKRSRAAAAGTT
jgi:osmotically-inducible protein OsmY